MIKSDDVAKQFMPFDALTGFYGALRQKEIVYDERIELSDEQKEEISETLLNAMPRDIMKIRYYVHRKYKTKAIMVYKINTNTKRIITMENEEIPFNDIFSLDLI